MGSSFNISTWNSALTGVFALDTCNTMSKPSKQRHKQHPKHTSSSASFTIFCFSLLAVVPLCHLAVAPYTKVEESFTLHAAHDISLSAPLESFDHITNPGPVPRSFIPPALLALPVRFLLHIWRPSDPFEIQLLLRGLLALANAAGLFFFINRAPQHLRLALLFLSISQFHFPFWSSRTIPNSLALPFVHIALAFVLFSSSHSHYGLAILACIAVVFRIEVAALLFVLFVYSLLSSRTTFFNAAKSISIAAVFSILSSLAVDSQMWSHFPLVPEISSFLFNVIHGKSAEWGVLPFHSYFTQFLPKLLLLVYPLAVIGLFIHRLSRKWMIISLSYVTLLSCLGHKEWRFIVYVLPLFNLSAIQTIYSFFSSKLLQRLAFLALIGSTLVATIISTFVSMYNYPGGTAMALIHNNLYTTPANITPVKVHVDVSTKMTGASLFTHPYDVRLGRGLWTYNRSETLDWSNPKNFDSFDIVIASNPNSLIDPHTGNFHTVAIVPGYAGLRRKSFGGPPSSLSCTLCSLLPIEIALEDRIWILQHNNNRYNNR